MVARTISLVLTGVLVVGSVSCTTAPGKSTIRLTGAGSTFAYPLYSKWADAFGKLHPDVEIDYQPIGSGGGIGMITDGRVDFGATDGPMSDVQIKAFADRRASEVLHVPTALGADVPAYNVPGLTAELKFTSQTLAGIFLGTIGKWDDPRIVADNSGAALPHADIQVVHRSDSSGSTYVWTDYLSKTSDEWRSKIGRGTAVHWPVGSGASGNQAVAEQISAVPYAIGYVELTYAIRGKLAYGLVQNHAGRFIKASLQSVTDAAAGSSMTIPEDFRVSITDAPRESAYPISTFTWILLPATKLDSSKREALVAFLQWGLTDGQELLAPLSYSRLPAGVVSKAQASLAKVR